MSDLEDAVLASLLILTILFGLILTLLSAATLGRKAADLEYQRRRKLNGVRQIQSVINIRTHTLRVSLGLTFVIAAVLVLVPVPEQTRIWVARSLFVLVLFGYALASLLDWVDERRQQDILVGEEIERERRFGQGIEPPAFTE